jgi:hypothetical protein
LSNPFDDTIAELDAELAKPVQPQAQQPAPSTESYGNPFEAAAAEASTQPEQPAGKVQGAGTPDSPYQGIIEFSQKIQEARKVGTMGFRESAMGHAVMSGRMTLEEAESQIAADDEMAQLSGDLEAYEKAAWDNWITGIPTSVALSTAKALPMLEESLKPFALGAVVGGGGAAATGVGTAVAVPVAGITGTAAAAGWAADLITGQEYLERRRQGMPHAEAAFASTVSGIIQGSIDGLQFSKVAKVPIAAAKGIIKAHAASITKFLAEGVRFGAEQIGLSEAQTATKLIVDAISGTVSKTPDVVPSVQEAVEEFGKTFRETLFSSIGLYAGGKAAGAGAGLGAKGFMDLVKKSHGNHMANQTAKVQAYKEKQLSADGARTVAGVDETAPKEPSKTAQERARQAAERLEKRQAAETEIKRIFAAAQSRFTIDTKETKMQEARRVQRLLKRMVTNSDKLDDGMKTKLLGRIVEIDSVADLLKEGQRFIDDARGREHANELAAAKDRLNAAIKSGQAKEGKAKLPAPAQASLKWYKEFFTAPEVPATNGQKRQPGEAAEASRQAALNKAQEFVTRGVEDEKRKLEQDLEKLESGELSEIFTQPAEIAEKRRIAMQAVQYFSEDGMSPEHINQLASDIEAIVKTQKSVFMERKKAESERLLNLRAKVQAGVQGVKPVVPSVADTAPKQMTAIGKIVNSVRRNSSALWDKLLQDTPADEREKIARILDFTDVENKESEINIKAAEKMTDLYTKAVGSMREASRLMRDGAKNEKFEDTYIDADGKPQIIGRASVNELVYLHLAMDDPGAIPGLLNGNKYTLSGMVEGTSTQEAVRNILEKREGGKYLKLAEAVRDYYRWFGPQVANHYLHEYGVSLPMNDNYSGQIFHRNLERTKSAADLLEDVHSFANRSLNPGSTKERSGSKLPIKLVDPFVQVQRQRQEMAFWIANSEKAREMSFIFSDSSKDGLRDIIQHKLGKEFNSLIDARIGFQFHLKPGLMDIADSGFQRVKNNLATGLLGARIDQAPKQWTSILGALSTNDYGQFLDGLRGAMDGKRMQEYLANSRLYADRQNELLPQILDATKERGYVDAVTGDRALGIKSFFLIPMSSWGDGVASAVTGFIEFNRVRKAGGTLEEAVLAGDSLVDRSQSSSRMSQRVPSEFKGGLANLSLAFAKQSIQLLNIESGAIRDYFNHKDAKHLTRAARTVAAIHTAQALFQIINTMPAWVIGDEDEKKDAALRVGSAFIGGSYSQLPLLGTDVVHGVLSGWKDEREPRTIIGGLVGDGTKLVRRSWKIAEKMAEGEEVSGEEWIKAFKSTAAVGSVVTGIPFWGLFKYGELGGKAASKVTGGGEE